MHEINYDMQGGKIRLTHTQCEYNKKDKTFETKQEPIKIDGKAADGGGYSTEAEASIKALKLSKQLRNKERTGKPSHGSFFS